EARGGGGERQPGRRAHLIRGEMLQPALERGGSPGGHVGRTDTCEQLAGALHIVTLDGEIDGRVHVAVALVPDARPPAEQGRALRARAGELALEGLGQQRVEAVLTVVAVEAGQQGIGAREVAEELRRAATPEDRIADRARESVEDGALGEKVVALAGQRAEDLVAQVVDDEAIVTSEPRQRQRWIRLFLRRDRGEVQGGRPALGASDDLRDRAR